MSLDRRRGSGSKDDDVATDLSVGASSGGARDLSAADLLSFLR